MKLTNQEVFDKAAAHMLTQRAQSRNYSIDTGPGLCMYRSPFGLKCAAGAIIPDGLYSPMLEMGGRVNSSANAPFFERLVEDLYHLLDLQYLHDECQPYNWRRKLAEHARYHDLDSSVLNKYPDILWEEGGINQNGNGNGNGRINK